MQQSSAQKYVRGVQLGEGTYGTVFSATVAGGIDNGAGGETRVAIKRVKPHNLRPGVNFTALREIKYLRQLIHPHIIQLIDTYVSEKVLYLVLEFCSSDLEKVIKDRSVYLTPSDVKSYAVMMLRAVGFCHSRHILHRDIKPSNLLIDSNGIVKLGDFGLARNLGSPGVKLTHEVATRWYRAPELLFGSVNYGYKVDVWSCGCVFGELLLRAPMFPGDSDTNQLARIFSLLGSPPSTWDAQSLPHYLAFEASDALPKEEWIRLTAGHSSSAVDLLLASLELDPCNRVSIEECLQHKYFAEMPLPTDPSLLKLPGAEKVTGKRARESL